MRVFGGSGEEGELGGGEDVDIMRELGGIEWFQMMMRA